jgi:hypothetical protein
MRIRGIKSPVQGNEAATICSFAATTTTGQSSFSQATGTMQFCFFPGHNTSDGDDYGVARHSNKIAVGVTPTSYIVGPMDSTAGTVSLNGVKSGIALGTAQYNVNTSASAALTWDVGLPMTCEATNTGHTRWRLVSMGVRFVNTTATESRAGSVVTVCPETRESFADGIDQELFAKYSTFEIHEVNKPIEVSWVPRSADFGYVSTSATAGTNVFEAGLFVWVNNPHTVAQTYSWELVCNWEIAGSSVKPLASLSLPVTGGEEVASKVAALHHSGISTSKMSAVADAVMGASKHVGAHPDAAKHVGFLTELFGAI